MQANNEIQSVFITGATGFVGKQVVREVTRRGMNAVCLVTSADKLLRQHSPSIHDRLLPVIGRLSDRAALAQAARKADAAIHLVGIIMNRRLQGKTFESVHVKGTQQVVDAVRESGIRRYAHMSALGARSDAPSEYHRTKFRAEESVRRSGLDWTIFRPSLIHGHEGEFTQLMKAFVATMNPPFIPYFGTGDAKLQPVSVKDVAHGMVESLFMPELVGVTMPMGGPKAISWRELYEICRRRIPGAIKMKPMISLPVPVAKGLAVTAGAALAIPESIPGFGWMSKFRFDGGQVMMAQEDSVCDHTKAEQAFGIQMRDFEEELSEYAGRIS